MLLELKNTTADNINKLMAFAKDSGIELSLVDDEEDADNYHLPGKPLTPSNWKILLIKVANLEPLKCLWLTP